MARTFRSVVRLPDPIDHAVVRGLIKFVGEITGLDTPLVEISTNRGSIRESSVDAAFDLLGSTETISDLSCPFEVREGASLTPRITLDNVAAGAVQFSGDSEE